MLYIFGMKMLTINLRRVIEDTSFQIQDLQNCHILYFSKFFRYAHISHYAFSQYNYFVIFLELFPIPFLNAKVLLVFLGINFKLNKFLINIEENFLSVLEPKDIVNYMIL